MNNAAIFQRLLWALTSITLWLTPLANAAAEPASLCTVDDKVLVFFNGVFTSNYETDAYVDEFRHWHGRGERRKNVQFESLYNQTEGLLDLVEVFQQRVLEQHAVLHERYELFFEFMNGNPSTWEIFRELNDHLDEVDREYRLYLQSLAAEKLASMAGNPSTAEDYAEHQARISNWILEGKSLLFVAHSQGNLFANEAYRFAQNALPEESLKVVHIAPASVQLYGPHILADKDKVIAALRGFGRVADVTTDIPVYLLRPAGRHNTRDIKGHGLLAIYLNQRLDISGDVKRHINAALDSLQPPPAEAASGLFTATLTWDGTGDVDMHVMEPSGTQVFYGRKFGEHGYLDVDNTSAYGPEHYLASCDPDHIGVGTYVVSLANYARADGRKATVQISSWNNGVLGTKTVALGNATGRTPAYFMFQIEVTENPDNGKFDVALVQ